MVLRNWTKNIIIALKSIDKFQFFELNMIPKPDEKISKLLEEKQKSFDAFADQSVAAEQPESYNVEVDEAARGQLI